MSDEARQELGEHLDGMAIFLWGQCEDMAAELNRPLKVPLVWRQANLLARAIAADSPAGQVI